MVRKLEDLEAATVECFRQTDKGLERYVLPVIDFTEAQRVAPNEWARERPSGIDAKHVIDMVDPVVTPPPSEAPNIAFAPDKIRRRT